MFRPGNNLLLAALIAWLAVIAGEVLVGQLMSQNSGSFVDIDGLDPETGFRHQPNAVTRQATSELDVEIRTNSIGFCDGELADPRPPDFCRILVMGDSFSFGSGVSRGLSSTSLLEQWLNDLRSSATQSTWNVASATVAGYDPYQHVRAVSKYAKPVDAVVILIGCVIGNDFGSFDSSIGAIIQNGNLLRVDGGGPSARAVTAGGQSRWSTRPAHEWLAINAHLYVLVRNSLFLLAQRLSLVDMPTDLRLRACRRTESRATNAATRRFLSEMRDLAAGVPTLVLSIPDRLEVDNSLWRQNARRSADTTDTIAVDVPNRVLNDALLEESIPFMDLLDPVLAHSSRALHVSHDNHWSPASHRFAAQQLRSSVSIGHGARVAYQPSQYVVHMHPDPRRASL